MNHKLFYVNYLFVTILLITSCSEKADNIESNKSFVLNESGSGSLKVEKETSIYPKINFTKKTTYKTSSDVIIADVGDISVDEKSRVFIKDDRQSTIHIFSNDGAYLNSIGREGRGPGEFSSRSMETKIEIGSDSMLYATDGSGDFAYRAQVFDLKDLSFSNTLKLRADNLNSFETLLGHTPKQVFPRSDGTFLVIYYPGLLQLRGSEVYINFVIQNLQGEVISNPILKLRNRIYLSQTVPTEIDTMSVMHSFPFSPKTVYDVAKNGDIYTAWTSDFIVNVYSQEGKLIRSIKHPFENLRLDIEKFKAFYSRTDYMSQLGNGVVEKMLDQEENIPSTWPAIEDLQIDDENRLWVSTVVENQDIYEWWVMEENGEVITQFEWSRDKPIEIIRNGSIYTREEQSDTGEEEIIRYDFVIEKS